MKHYIAVKMVEATPMNLGEYNLHKGWDIPKDEDPATEGYLVAYPDGYQSWSPKEAFDRSHLELDNPTKISATDLDRFIGPNAFSSLKLGDKTTLVEMNPRTGFVQYETSSCVDPGNYDHDLGCEIGADRIKDKLWPMLGFVLQWAKSGLAPVESFPINMLNVDSDKTPQ